MAHWRILRDITRRVKRAFQKNINKVVQICKKTVDYVLMIAKISELQSQRANPYGWAMLQNQTKEILWKIWAPDEVLICNSFEQLSLEASFG